MTPILEQLLATFVLEGVRAAERGDAERLKRVSLDMAQARMEHDLLEAQNREASKK